MGYCLTVFVSYAHEHRSIAEEISLALATRGHGVFFDRSTLESGVDSLTAILSNSLLKVFLRSTTKWCGSYAVRFGADWLTMWVHGSKYRS